MVKKPPRRKKSKQQPPRAVPRPAPKAQAGDEAFSGLLQRLGASEDERASASIRLENIEPDPEQPRRDFSEIELSELAATIRDLGVLQPIIVRPHPNGRTGRYMIVMGERRWRAASVAGLAAIPAVVRTGNSKKQRAQLVENLQRQDLGVLEIAKALRAIVDEAEADGESQASVARALGKDRAYVTRYLRMLKLVPELLELLETKRCSDMQVLLALDDFVRAEPARQGRLRAFLMQNPDFALSRGSLPSLQATLGGVSKPKPTGRQAVQTAAEHLLSVTGVRASVTRGKTELRIQCKSAEELAKVEAWLAGSPSLEELAN